MPITTYDGTPIIDSDEVWVVGPVVISISPEDAAQSMGPDGDFPDALLDELHMMVAAHECATWKVEQPAPPKLVKLIRDLTVIRFQYETEEISAATLAQKAGALALDFCGFETP